VTDRQTDRQTDRRTPHDGKDRAGKKGEHKKTAVREVGGVGVDKSDNVTLDPPRLAYDPKPSRDINVKVKV